MEGWSFQFKKGGSSYLFRVTCYNTKRNVGRIYIDILKKSAGGKTTTYLVDADNDFWGGEHYNEDDGSRALVRGYEVNLLSTDGQKKEKYGYVKPVNIGGIRWANHKVQQKNLQTLEDFMNSIVLPALRANVPKELARLKKKHL